MWWIGLFTALAGLLNLTCSSGKVTLRVGCFWLAMLVVGLVAMWVGS